MKHICLLFSMLLSVVCISLLSSSPAIVPVALAQSSCHVHFDCPPGKAVSAACSRDDACRGSDCISTTDGCTITCTGDCSEGGGTGVNQGVIPGGNSGGNSSGGTVSVCQLYPQASQCQSGGQGGGGNKPGGGNADPDDRCERFPNLPGCRSHTNDNPPQGNQNPDPKRDVSGTVWYDWDQNGRKTNGEPGIKDVRVKANPGNGHDDTNGNGDYEIKNLPLDRYTINPEEGAWKATTKKTDNVNLNQGNERNVDFGMFKGYAVPIYVFADMNGDGSGVNDPALSGITLFAQHTRVPQRVYADAISGANGSALLFPTYGGGRHAGLPGGGSTYNLWSWGYSTGFVPTGGAQRTFAIPNMNNVDQVSGYSLGITPQWRIRGYVFKDTNEDRIKNSNEVNINTAPIIRVTGLDSTNNFINYSSTNNPYGNLHLNADGTFEAVRLLPGRYRVTLTPPRNRTSFPISYTVTVGDATNPFPSYYCANANVTPAAPGTMYCEIVGNSQGAPVYGNVANLSFAIPPPPPWIRGYGIDIRFKENFINKVGPDVCDGAYASITSTTASPLSSTLTPGVMVSGTTGIMDFEPGKASIFQWRVQSTFSAPSRLLATSYGKVLSAARAAGGVGDLTQVQGCGDRSNCSPQNPPSGTYFVDGNLNITGWEVPANKSYILLVNGDLTIDGSIQVSESNGSLIIIVSKDVIVDASLGQILPFACGSEAPNIEGIISADHDVVIESTDNCTTEKALHVEGAIIANAGLGNGKFLNKRTLCDANDQHPVFSVRARPDLILNSPELIRTQKAEYRELVP